MHTQGEHSVKISVEMVWCSWSQGTGKIADKPPEAERKLWNRFSLPVVRRNQSCQHLDSWLLQLWETTFLFKHPACGTVSISQSEPTNSWCYHSRCLSSSSSSTGKYSTVYATRRAPKMALTYTVFNFSISKHKFPKKSSYLFLQQEGRKNIWQAPSWIWLIVALIFVVNIHIWSIFVVVQLHKTLNLKINL